ncbi:tetratricopeptide repeat protein [Nonomuraea sp. NEAU-A123]|uniref:tetratricopeptide repeat protein n=1 Tax=Nonomuraea sp. NEAU-A123 TaxID=2839649 RepID=UPI001BE462AD|nr:tetratricopeptide repeat protein [Nonomuraea sp. NEAU-A123]MBT2231669.1 tetratricopeptide/SEL1-like repeat protein [Nonomuraea sp. NEAU-A123]
MSVWRRMLAGVVLALMVVTAITAAALAKLPQPPTWAAAVIAGAAFTAGLTLDPFKKLAAEWIERPRKHREILRTHTRVHDHTGRLQRVNKCIDATVLGVHPAATTDTNHDIDRLPPYVKRDAHVKLREAFDVGGMVILEGPSSAGKTRLAFECMHAYAPDRLLIVPNNLTALREITKEPVRLRNSVIWLDDVERYLASGGLDGAVLDALVPHEIVDVLVLATLRAEARKELTSPDLETATARSVEEIMRRARVIPLERALSPDEQARAQELRADKRIAAALDQTTGAGFSEYLAASPAILERWQSAYRGEHPVAGAIISAAIDIRRVGYQAPVPRELLAKTYTHYLDPRIRHRSDLSTFDEGLAWATQLVKGASACLTQDASDTFHPFDYLIDHVQHASDLHQIPSTLWPEVLAHASIADTVIIGLSASFADQRKVSEQAFRRAAETGNIGAMYSLGVILKSAGQTKEAEQWYRRAAETGHPDAMNNLGILLNNTDRTSEAEQWYRRAAETGNTSAMYNLGILLDNVGNPEEAEQWYRRVAEIGHTNAMRNLGILLAKANRTEEAEQWYRRAAENGHANAMHNLGILLAETDRTEEAEQWYRRAANKGHTGAIYSLGNLSSNKGRVEEAEQWWRHAARTGHTNAMNRLANLLKKKGRVEEAEQWWHQAAQAGDTDAIYNLGVLLATTGQTEEAEQWYRRAAENSHANAMYNLGILLIETDRTEEAGQWWHQAAQAGYTEAMYNLGVLLAATGQTEEAEQWYRRAAENGYTDAMHNLGLLLDIANQTEEAEQWYRRAAENGDINAAYNLGVLLAKAGRTEEAGPWWHRAAESGHPHAMCNLGALLAAASQTEEAEQWWRLAAETGLPAAMLNLGVLLEDTNRTKEAELWYRRAAKASMSQDPTNP